MKYSNKSASGADLFSQGSAPWPGLLGMNAATNQDQALETLATDDVWQLAHNALCANRWSEARRVLDELGRRTDNPYRLASTVEAYMTAPLAPHYRQIIQDRIDLVNAKADEV